MSENSLEAIIAFLESKDFEDAVRNAVSLGGDTDTLGVITGSIAEAFYGIPAVLIAECKSRIDKGMMTDVLDEFDHVLGRSVDTYSDEVDETQANQMIEGSNPTSIIFSRIKIVINPFGKYIQMTKKMIELLINGYEYYENERKSKDDENN